MKAEHIRKFENQNVLVVFYDESEHERQQLSGNIVELTNDILVIEYDKGLCAIELRGLKEIRRLDGMRL